MANIDPQVPWSEEQWARVAQTVQKEAARARVAASFLPLVGPLPRDADFIKSGALTYEPPNPPPNTMESQTMRVEDRKVIPLTTLQVKVQLRGAQMSDPQLTSALEMFRRAANVLARLEDAIVFRGQKGEGEGPDGGLSGLPSVWKITGGEASGGLFGKCVVQPTAPGQPRTLIPSSGLDIVSEVSAKIGQLEGRGHFGPFAVVLGQALFADAQTPTGNLTLPSDRIIPFLGGGPLLRSSTLEPEHGVIVALGASPVELVIATDVTVGFLQVTTEPAYIFRVHERIAVRFKEDDAIECLTRKPTT